MTTPTVNKVTAEHLRRHAYLYVRQSSLQQVHDHRESTARQYDLKRRAHALGWPAEQIVVIDDDLGLSGASAAERKRLPTPRRRGRARPRRPRHGLGGLAPGAQLQRLASAPGNLRPGRDAHPRRGRHLRSEPLQRSAPPRPQGHHERGRAARAAGAAPGRPPQQGPPGRPLGAAADRVRVRRADAAPRPRSRHADPGRRAPALRDLPPHRLRHPGRAALRARGPPLAPPARRPARRPARSCSSPLDHSRVLNLLHNPRYAGAFVYGRTRQRTVRVGGQARYRRLPRAEWKVFLPNVAPGLHQLGGVRGQSGHAPRQRPQRRPRSSTSAPPARAPRSCRGSRSAAGAAIA